MSTDPGQETLTLPNRFDRSAAIELKTKLDEHSGADLLLDGSEVEVVGGLGLQLLHYAKQHWASSGWALEVTAPSETLAAALSWLETAQNENIGELS